MKQIIAITFSLCLIASSFGAWITHIIVAVQAKAWLLLIAGAIMPPIGVIHGIATWFGVSWV